MIIENGTISLKAKQAGGIDPETGYPVKSTEKAWGDTIPCQYVAASLDLQARTSASGSAIKKVSWTIYVEECLIDSEQLRLYDRGGNLVGEYSITQVEPLDAVGEMRIYC